MLSASFSYSRLEALCAKRGVPDRFGKILKQQGEVLLALEFVLTMSTLGLATVLCCWIGWPEWEDGSSWSNGPLQYILKYVLFAALAFVAADLLPWTIARVASEQYLCTFWPFIEALQSILGPLLWIALQMDRYAHRLAGRTELETDDSSKIEEEIRSVVEEGEREGGPGIRVDRDDPEGDAASGRRCRCHHNTPDRDGLCQCRISPSKRRDNN